MKHSGELPGCFLFAFLSFFYYFYLFIFIIIIIIIIIIFADLKSLEDCARKLCEAAGPSGPLHEEREFPDLVLFAIRVESDLTGPIALVFFTAWLQTVVFVEMTQTINCSCFNKK